VPRILVSASFPETLLARQTPEGIGRWDEFEFIFSPSAEPVDAWVVYDDLREPIDQLCPRSNTLLITGEPESIRRYRSRFTSQFGKVWTSQERIKHPALTRRNEAQHWHYAMRNSQVHGSPLSFNQLTTLEQPQKTKWMSVICSNKALTPDHQKRLEFVRLLQENFGDSIDFFGRGFQPVEDKADAIWPYRYHIVLENDHTDHFMTEKLSDAYLGWSYPIYFGGSEAYHRFPHGSFTAIDIYQPEQAISIIRCLLTGQMYEESTELLAAARNNVLYQNNLFPMLADYWRSHLSNQRCERVQLLPKSHRTSLILNQLARAARRTLTRQAA
jgi:hypothetical protein